MGCCVEVVGLATTTTPPLLALDHGADVAGSGGGSTRTGELAAVSAVILDGAFVGHAPRQASLMTQAKPPP
jgi:hypothetical protein